MTAAPATAAIAALVEPSALSTSWSTMRASAHRATSRQTTTTSGDGCWTSTSWAWPASAAAALPYLRQSDHAAIVNTSSVAAVLGVPDRVALLGQQGRGAAITLAMAADHSAQASARTPSPRTWPDTPWVSRLLDRADDPAVALAALQRRQPMGRLVTADEVAHAIAYLASPLSASTTGTLLAVDGGMSNLRI